MINHKILLTCCTLLVTVACAKKADEASVSVTAADGTWVAPCTVSSNNTDSTQDTFSVVNGTLTYHNKTYYATTTCLAANLGLIFEATGPISITGDSTVVTGAKEYQFTLSSMTAETLLASQVSVMNSGTYCGASDWAVGVAKNVLGCSTFGMSNLTSATIVYDILKVDTTATPNTIQFGTSCNVTGDASFCTTGVTRPTTLNTATSSTFSKQ